MSNTASTELVSKAVSTSIISLKTPTEVARSLEISTTRDRSASVILSISFATGVVVGGVRFCCVSSDGNQRGRNLVVEVWPIKFWAKSFATGIKHLVDDS
jgi:hypothetical protein